MNHAELMASAYALYSQNLAAIGSLEKTNILDQIQTYLSSTNASLQSTTGSTLASSTTLDKLTAGDSANGTDRSDDGIRPACRFCGKTFAQASYIKAHERLHTGEKPYVCSVCHKAFSDASNWKKHERMHSRQIQSAIEEGVLPLVSSASSTPEPRTPTATSPTLSIPQISTPLSSFTSQFQSSQNAMSMPLSFSSQLSTQIQQIQASVSAAALLELQTSADDSDLSPPIKKSKESKDSMKDPRDGATRDGMGRDLVGGSMDPSLTCNLCGKVFSTPASLSMHRKIHTGERPHTCSTCGKSFTQVGTLRAHERTHSGEKPYECTYCGKTFAQCGSYRMHERRHHRDLLDSLQRCYVCAASFSTMEELQKHMICHPGTAAALNLNLHPGAFGFPSQMAPLNFPLTQLTESTDVKAEMRRSESAETSLSEIEKAFNLYSGAPKSAPAAVSFPEHFQLPPFASTAHALIHRSLSQGSSPDSAMSMFLSSNGGDGMCLLNRTGLLSPTHLPSIPMSRPDLPILNLTGDKLVEQKTEGVDEVSTTTRSRKYSSDSHTSLSLPDHPSDPNLSQLNEEGDTAKADNENNEQETENDADAEVEGTNEPDSGNQNQKTPSEDSSLPESRSTEDFQSDDQHSGICRQNLNRRMMSNSRKQRHPMRRLSSSRSIEPESSERRNSSNPPDDDGENEEENEGMDEIAEKISRDQMMVSFLLSRGDVYKCEHCHIIFEDCTLYLLHNGFHANDTDPFKCVICKKSCEGRVEFNCHLTSHIKS